MTCSRSPSCDFLQIAWNVYCWSILKSGVLSKFRFIQDVNASPTPRKYFHDWIILYAACSCNTLSRHLQIIQFLEQAGKKAVHFFQKQGIRLQLDENLSFSREVHFQCPLLLLWDVGRMTDQGSVCSDCFQPFFLVNSLLYVLLLLIGSLVL